MTTMLQVAEFKTIYNIFVVVLIIFSLQTVVDDVISSGSFRGAFDFSLMVWAFGQLSVYASCWVGMFMQTIAVFRVFQSWALSQGKSNGFYKTLYVLHLLTFMVWPFLVVVQHNLPPASAMIVMCEQIRMIMKTHSYVRENVPQVRNRYQSRNFGERELQALGVDFSHYMYFLFAPTLLYRTSYPRTPRIRWHVVFVNFSEVVFCLLYTYYVFVRFCVPQFSKIGKSDIDIKMFIHSVFNSMLPGTLVLLLAFFCILHSWLNTWAGE